MLSHVCDYADMPTLLAIRGALGDRALASPRLGPRRPGETWWSLRRFRRAAAAARRRGGAGGAGGAAALLQCRSDAGSGAGLLLLLDTDTGDLRAGALRPPGGAPRMRPVVGGGAGAERWVAAARYSGDRALLLGASGRVYVYWDPLGGDRPAVQPLPRHRPPVAAIAAADTHYLLLGEGGSVWSAASSWHPRPAALGRGGGAGQPRPVEGLPGPVRAIAAGRDASFFVLRSDRSLWACGTNSWDQLALGPGGPGSRHRDRDHPRPVRVPLPASQRSPVREAICASGALYTLHEDRSLCAGGWLSPLRCDALRPWLRGVAAAAATDCHVVVLLASGAVLAAGSFGEDGKLGRAVETVTAPLATAPCFAGPATAIAACNLRVPLAVTIVHSSGAPASLVGAGYTAPVALPAAGCQSVA